MFSILLLFCLIAIVDSQSQCPAGFVANDILGCVLPPGTHATYDTALTSCQQLGATLPIIHNNNTHQALIAYIRTQSPFYFYWIGLRRRTGNLFIWSDQSMVDFQAWQPNRPTSNIGYDCVSMFAGSTDVGWRDSVCVDSNPYVCITPKLSSSTSTPLLTTTTTSSSGPCPGDTYSGSGFIQSPYYPSQYQNNADCQYHISVGSGQYVLVTIVQFQTESCCDYLFLYNGPTISSPLLVRLSGTVSAGQQYESTGNQLTGRFTSDVSVTDVGFRINFNSTSVGPTTPTTPTQFPPTSPSPQCGRDFIYYPRDNLCFHWQYSLNTFDQANAICTGLNSTLASIHNTQVEQFLISYLINSTMNIDRWVTFIGLQTTVNGTFTRWTDGSAIDYTSWINGEPNTANGGCAVIQPYAPFGWHTWNCQTARPSLCMKRSM